jgi:hypothetical protein
VSINSEDTPMRDYTATEMDWEYNVEYLKYSFNGFPNAFASREDFQAQYDAAPCRVLTQAELYALDNSMAYSGYGRSERWVRATFSRRRDVDRVMTQLRSGTYCPPIILERNGRLHLMAGQTRLATGAALGIPVNVKIISVK